MRGLYAIVDTDTLASRGLDPTEFAEAVLAARPAAMQLRDKRRSSGPTLALLRSIAPLCARAGVPFFANDRADLAALAGCDGVHLGQEDAPAEVARAVSTRCGRPLRIGLSTHDFAQLERALDEAPDYAAIGPVFPTRSKERPSPVIGLERLSDLARAARTRRPGVSLVAIGGIGPDAIGDVARVCDAVAVIGALLPDGVERAGAILDAVTERARTLHGAVVSTRLGGDA